MLHSYVFLLKIYYLFTYFLVAFFLLLLLLLFLVSHRHKTQCDAVKSSSVLGLVKYDIHTLIFSLFLSINNVLNKFQAKVSIHCYGSPLSPNFTSTRLQGIL